MKTPLRTARLRLAWIWFPASGVLFMIFVGQSLGGIYGNEVQKIFGWALPNFLPTISLMMSVFAQDALIDDQDQIDKTFVRNSFLNIAIATSIFYLSLIYITVIASSFIGSDPFATIEISNVFLGPIQGIVVGALGVLFFVRETDG